jgi:hypothetical protein
MSQLTNHQKQVKKPEELALSMLAVNSPVNVLPKNKSRLPNSSLSTKVLVAGSMILF